VRPQLTTAAGRSGSASTRAGARSAFAASSPAGPAARAAVVVAGLCKSYGTVQAVRGVSFTVQRGEIFALLRPNGAGKTSILEILEGFRACDAGRIDVLGINPGDRSQGGALRERIGPVLQDTAVEPHLTVRETIARNASGGQKRRLDLALIRNAEATPAVVQLVLFPLVFVSGTYMPIHSAALNRIAGAVPVRPFNQALLGPFAQQTGFDWKTLGVLLAWGAAGALVAVRRFRWNPRPE